MVCACGRWMRRVYETKLRPAHAELNAVAVIERRWACDALLVYERPVEAAQINEHGLTVALLNLRVTTRDDCCRSLNRHFHSRLATQSRHILCDLYALKLSGRAADKLYDRRLRRS